MSGLPYTLPRELPGGASTVADSNAVGGTPDGTLVLIADLCEQGKALLISEYGDNAPNLRAFLCALLESQQETENGILAVYSDVLNVDAAEGVHLDLLGKLVGEPRAGLSDYVYRRAIRTRILINRSQGRVEDFVRIVRMFEEMDDLLTGEPNDPDAYVRVSQPPPGDHRCSAEVRIVNTPANIPREIHKRLVRAKAAGVGLTTMTIPYPGTSTGGFRLSRAADYPEKNTTEGLSSFVDGGGGRLLHAMR